jgi:signal transduction histidine kinase
MNVFKVVKRNRMAFLLACCAAAATVLMSEGSYQLSVDTLGQLSSTDKADADLQALQLGFLEAESGQRGYLLTSRKEYLKPYEKALQRIDDSLSLLDLYYENKPGSGELLDRLHAASKSRLSELATAVRLHDEGREAKARELMLSDLGNDKLDQIRALGAQLLQRESIRLVENNEDTNAALMLRRISVAALSFISLFALFMYQRKTFSSERKQEEVQALVQAERDRLEVEVKERSIQLTALTNHLQTAREDERQRLARDLHDELGALLTSAKLDAARINSRLKGRAPEAIDLLAHLVGTLNSGIALGRRIIEDLRPSALSNLGLVATLEILMREFSEQTGVQVHCTLEPVELKPSSDLMVYRVVQEAITNITKYAGAKHVWVMLSARDGQVDVSVRDDGVGFDIARQTRSAYGLVGMRFRVEAEDGVMNLVSSPGQGALIQVSLPKMR